jgi:hypothetical protein
MLKDDYGDPLKDIQRNLINFMLSSEIAPEDGAVLSWINAANTGYIYPEVMGYYLSLFSYLFGSRKWNVLQQRAQVVSLRLHRFIHPNGGIGREQDLYAFDTGIAINGFLAMQNFCQIKLNLDMLTRMTNFLYLSLKNRQIMMSLGVQTTEVPRKWSTQFGASMLKTCIALHKIAKLGHKPHLHALIDDVVYELTNTCFHGGTFYPYLGESSIYTHAHCYALEGLLYLHHQGYSGFRSLLRAGADQLKCWQNQDGSLFNWYNNPSVHPLKVSDATAQAIRIWLAIDRVFYAPQIQRGFDFLISLIAPGMGLYYSTRHQDINSWSTIFVIQAIEWYIGGIEIEYII